LAVIAPTIIPGVEDYAELVDFYERAYSMAGPEAARYGRWRTLGAIGKADHVIALCRRAGLEPASTLDVGCGDGALLVELANRGFGGRLAGMEISEPAAAIARGREQLEEIGLFDGRTLPSADGAYELGILSHVLEHVPRPAELLAEVARVCRAVVIEVPLEANWSAGRASKREHAAEIGHLQRLDRGAARAIVAEAGLAVGPELQDPLPLAVHRFFAESASARAAAAGKWALRLGLSRLAPPLARRVFTVHYSCLCVTPGA
jgi:SAM-dependent methyltransferase